jgi:hypothetical protein
MTPNAPPGVIASLGPQALADGGLALGSNDGSLRRRNDGRLPGQRSSDE